MNIRDYYDFLEIIGSGASGSVYKAREKTTGQHVSVKMLRKNSNDSLVDRVREILPGLMRLDHVYIVHYYEWFEDEDFIYIVMEYLCNGSLLEYVNQTGGLSEDKVRIYLFQLINILEYLHKDMNIIHRDLKAENLLIDQFNNLRLIDFGFSKKLDKFDDLKKQTICGSPAYAAPEILMRSEYNSKVDIWSVGVITYAMISGKLPFDASNFLSQVIVSEPEYDFTLSSQLKDLIQRMLTKEIDGRISLDEIKNHPFILKLNIPKLLVVNPSQLTVVVVLKMQNFNIDTKNLAEELKKGEVNHTTAVYKMMNTERMLSELMTHTGIPRIIRTENQTSAFPLLGESRSTKSTTKVKFVRISKESAATKSSPAVLRNVTLPTLKMGMNRFPSLANSPLIMMPNVRRRTRAGTNFGESPSPSPSPVLGLIQ